MGPAHQLTGLTLPGNWKVLQLAARKPNATGSNFSVGYVVENENGRRGFLKAIDYFGAFNQGLNTPDVLNAMTSAYIFERDICEKCRDHRLSRIVHAIDSGSHQLDPKQGITRVDYLIFELADSDIRAHLDAQQHFDVAFALRTLHNVATGLSQMHAHEMAHQDLKPSNVLIFKGPVTSKIGDLGRAWSKHHTAPHDTHPIAGDGNYAPIELLYGEIATDHLTRRFGCDAYHLGSLQCFLFTRTGITALLHTFLDPQHRWMFWHGRYREVLPYIQDAFRKTLHEFERHVPDYLRRDLSDILSHLCEPDPQRRGHPVTRERGGNPFALERHISAFDRLAYKAELILRGKQL